MAINYVAPRNVYPALGGETIGDLSTAGVMRGTATAPKNGGGDADVNRALTVGGQASPLMGLVVFLGLSLAIMLLAQRVGEPEEFRNIKASAYNVLLISLVAAAGIPVWKWLFTRVPVPGVSAWVLSV